MTKREQIAAAIILLLIGYIVLIRQTRTETVRDENTSIETVSRKAPQSSHTAQATPKIDATQVQVKPIPLSHVQVASVPASQEEKHKATPPTAVQYQVDEDGLAVVDGDIVLGEAGPGQTGAGTASPASLQLWPGGKIPYFIQADLNNQERVVRALGLFDGSGLRFSLFQGEPDVLVFQNAESGGCKSYLGKVGGKQPIWIGPHCGPTEIAHEIMHAVGFIHEQNRTDRDRFVQVIWNNVIESAKGNFELFPSDLMKVSGTAGFDYESIMLYQPTAFSKNGEPTLMATQADVTISPSRNLSPSDIVRIKRAYQVP